MAQYQYLSCHSTSSGLGEVERKRREDITRTDFWDEKTEKAKKRSRANTDTTPVYSVADVADKGYVQMEAMQLGV